MTLKHVEGWRLNKTMKSIDSVRSIPGAWTSGMAQSVKKCLEDISPNTLTIPSKNTKVLISGLTIRNYNLDKRGKEVHQLLESKCLFEKLSFIDNQNINLKMLNQSIIYLNEYGTRRLVNNFCYNLIKWWDAIYLDKNTIEIRAKKR